MSDNEIDDRAVDLLAANVANIIEDNQRLRADMDTLLRVTIGNDLEIARLKGLVRKQETTIEELTAENTRLQKTNELLTEAARGNNPTFEPPDADPEDPEWKAAVELEINIEQNLCQEPLVFKQDGRA